MPENAVTPVAPVGNIVMPVSPGETADNRNHLIVGQSRFINKLIIANTGIGFSRFDNPVKNIVAVLSLVEGKIKFS